MKISAIFKLSISVLLLIFFNIKSSAQPIDFKKLKEDVVNAQSNIQRANAMMVLGASYRPSQKDSTLFYADSLSNFKLEGKDAEYYKQASNYLKAVGLYRTGKLEEAREMFYDCIKYFDKENFEISLKCKNFIGISFLRTNQYDSAIAIYENLLKVASVSNQKARLSSYGNLAKAYAKNGNYALAIENFEEVMNIGTISDFSVVNTYMSIAFMYIDMDMYEDAIATMKMVNIDTITDSPIKVAYLNNMGHFYADANQFDSAVFNLKKGIVLSEKTRSYNQGINNRLKLSEIYLSRNQLDSSRLLLDKVKAYIPKYAPRNPQILTHAGFAKYWLAYPNPDSAIHYARIILELSNKTRRFQEKGEAYKIIAEAYQLKGNLQQSNLYYRMQNDFSDSLQQTEKIQFLANAKSRFLLRKKEKEISEKETENEAIQSQIFFLGEILLAALLVIIVIFYLLRRSKEKLHDQANKNLKMEIEVKKQQIEKLTLKSKALLPVDDIISIKADGHYLEFKLTSKKRPEIDRNQLSNLIEKLPSKFIRTHRSHVVNIEFIKVSYRDRVVLKDGTELPISRTYQKTFSETLESFGK